MDPIRVIVDGAGGRMGRTVTRVVAEQPDMQLVGAVDAPGMPFLGQDAGLLAGIGALGVPVVDSLGSVIEQGDVVIEFTLPEATLANLRTVVEHRKRMVIATTGYDAAQRQELERLAQQIPCVIAPNYSIGVNVLLRAVALVAAALGSEYDVEITEVHHNQKKDAPSGTALRLAEVVAEALNRDLESDLVYGRQGITGARSRREIGVHALRGGDVVGDHTVFFFGNGERLELTHRAHSRETFARGAVRAARWVMTAPVGMHDFNAVLFGG
ncbi:MAG: 4-hydroxy-tetrahydrodipicolinate reductase [Candidatus Poribacteria bacterium]|nr:MAG: 4-hydroxy-tetrahydrodipicolinate reductase [Candidatus Poribacteria bacterium]